MEKAAVNPALRRLCTFAELHGRPRLLPCVCLRALLHWSMVREGAGPCARALHSVQQPFPKATANTNFHYNLFKLEFPAARLV